MKARTLNEWFVYQGCVIPFSTPELTSSDQPLMMFSCQILVQVVVVVKVLKIDTGRFKKTK